MSFRIATTKRAWVTFTQGPKASNAQGNGTYGQPELSAAVVNCKRPTNRKRPLTTVFPLAPRVAMIEFGAQIDCVHKSIYGQNNSTSPNQGQTGSVSPTQR